MTDLSWVKEVKEVASGIGYSKEGKKDAIKKLNALLSEDWRLIAIVTDQKYVLDLTCTVTSQYYILGR